MQRYSTAANNPMALFCRVAHAAFLYPLRFFLQGAHAAPLHPRRCHRHFCTFGLCAFCGVGLARLMWRNPAPRFRLLWRKPGFVLRHDCRIRGMFPPEPPRSSAHASSLLGAAVCRRVTPYVHKVHFWSSTPSALVRVYGNLHTSARCAYQIFSL